MEVINQGSEKLKDLAALGCCWPPGTMNSFLREVSDEE